MFLIETFSSKRSFLERTFSLPIGQFFSHALKFDQLINNARVDFFIIVGRKRLFKKRKKQILLGNFDKYFGEI